MPRKWGVLVAVSLMFFFITSATFMSLGVVLFRMTRDLGWTQTEAGGSFSVLGLACCFSSLAPMPLVDRIGSHWTMMLGALVLALGFLAAFMTHGLPLFLVGTALMGVGFSLTANIPGVYLLARWFPARSGRIIGVYLMFGALGGVAGPPLAQAVAASAGWRAWWLLLAIGAAAMGLLCLVLVRDRVAPPVDPENPAADGAGPAAWRYGAAIRTPQFAILALAMVITETCVSVVHTSAVTHFSKLGLTAAFGALMLSAQALMATAGKGISGTLGDWISPRLLLAGGLALESLGMILLGFAGAPMLAYAFAVSFGIGWGTAYLAITVLLIDYFGPRTGSAVLSLVWLLTGFAALGPTAAGMAADRLGTFAPAFEVSGALLLPVALAALLMGRPVSRLEARGPRVVVARTGA